MEEDLGRLLEAVRFRVLRARLVTRDAFGPRNPLAVDLRGGLGRHLTETSHLDRLFKPPMPKDGFPPDTQGGQGASPPFRLRAPSPSHLPIGGGELDVEITSFLTDDDTLSIWQETLMGACRQGFGQPQARFHVRTLDVSAPTSLMTHALAGWERLAGGLEIPRLRVDFPVPARILVQGEEVPPEASPLVHQLLRRLQSLAWLYGDWRSHPALTPLLELATETQFAPNTVASWRKVAQFRDSATRHQPLHGHLGFWEGGVPRPVGLLLLAGEVMGAGKSTALGLGEMRVGAPAGTGRQGG